MDGYDQTSSPPWGSPSILVRANPSHLLGGTSRLPSATGRPKSTASGAARGIAGQDHGSRGLCGAALDPDSPKLRESPRALAEFARPSFSRTFLAWTSAVFSAITSSSAIRRFV